MRKANKNARKAVAIAPVTFAAAQKEKLESKKVSQRNQLRVGSELSPRPS